MAMVREAHAERTYGSGVDGVSNPFPKSIARLCYVARGGLVDK